MSMNKKTGLWIALGILCGTMFLCMVGCGMGLMVYVMSVEKESSHKTSVESTETESSDEEKESITDESESSSEASSEVALESEASLVEGSEITYNSEDTEQMLDELLELYEKRPSVSELE